MEDVNIEGFSTYFSKNKVDFLCALVNAVVIKIGSSNKWEFEGRLCLYCARPRETGPKSLRTPRKNELIPINPILGPRD